MLTRLERARMEGELAAQRELAQMGVRPGEKVDVLGAIERAGIWLMFAKMKTLFGCYRRVNGKRGILINSQHPPPLQRFTAAHEYGHHVLGHRLSLDDEGAIFRWGAGSSTREAEAYAFGANFLMPFQSVEWHLRRLGYGKEERQVTPLDVYSLSVEMGVSYKAMVSQLTALSIIDQMTGRSLKEASPLALKTELLGRPPENAGAGVWHLSLDDSDRRVEADPGDEIVLRLPETPTSGYRWKVDAIGSSLELADDDELMPNGGSDKEEVHERYGAEYSRVFRFRVKAGPAADSLLSCNRRWPGADSAPSRTMGLHVVPAIQRMVKTGQGISLQQQDQLLSVAA